MNRTQFWYRQRATAAEFNNDTLDEVELADWNVVKEILGYGVFNTPVVVEASVPDLTVDVPIVLGYDQVGRRVELPIASAPYNLDCSVDENSNSTAVVGSGNEKWLSVFIEFTRLDSEPKTDGNGTPLFWKHDESFQLNVVQGVEAGAGTAIRPLLRSDQILLCDILLVFGQTQIFNADIYHNRREDFVYEHIPGTYIGELLGFMGRAYQPANINAPGAPATTLDITSIFGSGGTDPKTPGGDSSTRGVITTPTGNYVKMFDANRDHFLDSATGDKVFARITESGGTWTLSFFTYPAGGPETAFDMGTGYPGAVIQWYVQEVFSLDSFPVEDPMFAVQSDQIAGEVPDGTETLKGKVQFAPDGGTNPLEAVQGSDSRLLPQVFQLIRKLASKPSLVFNPYDSDPLAQYRLHQYHGLAKGDFQVGGSPYEPGDFYFEYDPSHSDYPLNVWGINDTGGLGNALTGVSSTDQLGVITGYADNTAPVGTADTFYYVYLIGRAGGVPPNYALVFSNRAPWDGGPLLDNSVFNFWTTGTPAGDQDGWRYWRFIACLVSQSTPGVGVSTPWEWGQIRKKGDFVTYELTQDPGAAFKPPGFGFSWNHGGVGAFDSGWLQTSWGIRVPPTSIRALFVLQLLTLDSDGELMFRPPALGSQPLHETPSTAYNSAWQFYMKELGLGDETQQNAEAWGDLNTSQQNDCRLTQTAGGGVGSNTSGVIYLKGYQELADFSAAEASLTW